MAAATEKTKRRWGKSRHREKITIVDRMEIEDTLQKFAEEEKSFKDRHEVASTPTNDEPDLQQPELMSDFALVEALRKIKVPVPVYADGTPSRERLIYLFRQHVTPRPQRMRQGRRPFRRRDRKLKRLQAASVKSNEAEHVAMEVDGAAELENFWAVKSDGSWVLPLQRKRYYLSHVCSVTQAPPTVLQAINKCIIF